MTDAIAPTGRFAAVDKVSAPRASRRSADPGRRLKPNISDTDWLVLRGLRGAVVELVGRVEIAGGAIMDFGCGTRPYERLFTDLGARYVGADFADAEVAISAEGRINAPDACADGVVSFQVLEHVRDVRVYLSETRRILRDDGWLILSTHGSWLYHPHPEDHRRWTRQGLIGDIELGGFKVQACIPVVGPLAWTTMLRLTCACYALRRIPFIGAAACKILSVPSNLKSWIEDAVTPAWVTLDNACVYAVLARKA